MAFLIPPPGEESHSNILKSLTSTLLIVLSALITDNVTKFLPELPYKTITIGHLLTNTSGIPDFYEVMKDKWKENRLATNDDMIHYLSQENAPLHFQPGQKYEDTGTGFALLASVIEKIAGLSYKDFLQQNIFNPLHLMHTAVLIGVHAAKTINPQKAQAINYDEITKKYLPARQLVPSGSLTFSLIF
ncbi:MAG: serine hydrolase [Segetibacter sp.]